MLRFKPFATSKVWKFPDPDTGHMHQGGTKADLIKRIVLYRAQNQLPQLDMINMVIENYLCGLSMNAGSCEQNLVKQRGLMQFIKGGVALFKSMWYNSTVSQEEADRRGEICTNCPKNVFPDKTNFVQWSDQIAQASIGDKRSKYHDALGNCAVCSCPLRAKVFYNGKFEFSAKELKEFPSFCWQLAEVKKQNGK